MIREPAAAVGLSTASVYPESTAFGFELAGRLGYDAVEVMVGIDPISQDIDAVRHLADYHEMPICSVHAPPAMFPQLADETDDWPANPQAATRVPTTIEIRARTIIPRSSRRVTRRGR